MLTAAVKRHGASGRHVDSNRTVWFMCIWASDESMQGNNIQTFIVQKMDAAPLSGQLDGPGDPVLPSDTAGSRAG